MANGFTINGQHSSTFGVIVNKKAIPLTAPMEHQTETVAGRDGAWFFGVSFGIRTIEVDVTLIATNKIVLRSNLRELIKAVNPVKGELKLIFDDDPTIVYFARLGGQLPLEQIGAYGTFTMQFQCTDPFAYSSNENVRNGTSMTINHLGSYIAKPIITVTTTGEGSITNTKSGGIKEVMKFTEEGTYTIDCKNYTLKKLVEGKQEPAYQTVTGDFFTFESGTNSISSSTGISSMTIKYRDTWL